MWRQIAVTLSGSPDWKLGVGRWTLKAPEAFDLAGRTLPPRLTGVSANASPASTSSPGVKTPGYFFGRPSRRCFMSKEITCEFVMKATAPC